MSTRQASVKLFLSRCLALFPSGFFKLWPQFINILLRKMRSLWVVNIAMEGYVKKDMISSVITYKRIGSSYFESIRKIRKV